MPTYGTTDRCTGGVASADSITGGYVAANACDDDAGTFWASANTAFPHWWKYDFGAGITWRISQLTIKAGIVGTSIGIKDFTLQGSKDDSNWTVLYTGQQANNTDIQTFSFINKNLYRYCMINITTDWEAGYEMTYLNEVQMFEGIYPGGGLGIGNPWIFMKDMWEKHDKLWKPKLILPKDLGFQM